MRYGVLVPQTVVDVLSSLHLDGFIAIRALLTPKVPGPRPGPARRTRTPGPHTRTDRARYHSPTRPVPPRDSPAHAA